MATTRESPRFINAAQLAALRESGPIASNRLLAPDRVLACAGGYTVVYGPFDSEPSTTARLIILGLTPGFTQLEMANEALLAAKTAGITDPEEISALRRSRAAFAGSMRTNLVRMLNDLGLPDLVGISSTEEFFSTRADLAFPASALRYPVFVGSGLRNFGGAGNMMSRALFQEMVTAFLEPQLRAMPQALILPLGKAVEGVLDWLCDRAALERGRILRGFPHPSGGNGHRVSQFRRNSAALRGQLRNWFCGADEE